MNNSDAENLFRCLQLQSLTKHLSDQGGGYMFANSQIKIDQSLTSLNHKYTS